MAEASLLLLVSMLSLLYHEKICLDFCFILLIMCKNALLEI